MCGSKLIKTIHKIHDPLDLDNKILDKVGLPSLAGKENGLMPDLLNGPAELTGSTVANPNAAPTEVDGGVLAAREDERRRRASAAGHNSTILSSNLGSAPTGHKTLLGV